MAGELTNLVKDKRQVAKVVCGFESAIMRSFGTDAVRDKRNPRMTASEVKRRFELCIRIFKELRGDLKWRVEKIMDQLPGLLRAELDGVPWIPNHRSMWSPQSSKESNHAR